MLFQLLPQIESLFRAYGTIDDWDKIVSLCEKDYLNININVDLVRYDSNNIYE